ncbi:pyruvate flavodoxin oxidoreductase subunit alpha [compost metagenome]
MYTNVNSALVKSGLQPVSLNFIAGLGGRDISKEHVRDMFHQLQAAAEGPSVEPGARVQFIGLGVAVDE